MTLCQLWRRFSSFYYVADLAALIKVMACYRISVLMIDILGFTVPLVCHQMILF
jgi:hypothetical protein